MKAHLRYLSYVLRHKWFVFLAGLRTGAPLWRLIIHDWAKFTPREWRAYVAQFYGGPPYEAVLRRFGLTEIDPDHLFYREFRIACVVEQQRRRAAFDRAWLHHQHASPHHWQHWVLREDNGDTVTLPMPEPLVREMVADWAGAGRAITGRWEVAEWYFKNSARMLLHDETRSSVRLILPTVDGMKRSDVRALVLFSLGMTAFAGCWIAYVVTALAR